MNSRTEAIEVQRNRAIATALDAVLKLADPNCDDVMIRPLAPSDADEIQWRTDQQSYLLTYIAEPLANALTRTSLATYTEVYSQRMNEFLDANAGR